MERRYRDEEVAEIFRAAASEPSGLRAGGSGGGLTLAELQAIGREVGVAPERIAEAAASLGRSGVPLARGKLLGMPTTVGRTVELPRAPTDREWGILVGEMREIFRAPGREASGAELRGWSNGNLHVVVEPTVTGHRLRLGSRKADAGPAGVIAIGWLVLAILLVLGSGGELDEIAIAILLGLGAGGALAFNRNRLTRWADEREAQMEYLAARALEILSSGEGGRESAPDQGIRWGR